MSSLTVVIAVICRLHMLFGVLLRFFCVVCVDNWIATRFFFLLFCNASFNSSFFECGSVLCELLYSNCWLLCSVCWWFVFVVGCCIRLFFVCIIACFFILWHWLLFVIQCLHFILVDCFVMAVAALLNFIYCCCHVHVDVVPEVKIYHFGPWHISGEHHQCITIQNTALIHGCKTKQYRWTNCNWHEIFLACLEIRVHDGLRWRTLWFFLPCGSEGNIMPES